MNCPYCVSTKSTVEEQARLQKGNLIGRTRICLDCGTPFRTVELLRSSINRLHELLRARRDMDSQIADLIGTVRRGAELAKEPTS